MESIYTFPFFYYHSQSLPVGVVLVERQEVFPFLKIKPPPPLWLNRVKCSPFIHSHCFYHHSQCLRTKIKFTCGCGASRKAGSISISKNKAPTPLWLNRVKCSPFIHFHCFYHDSQCLRTKIKFACGCGASRKARSISISKNKAPPMTK